MILNFNEKKTFFFGGGGGGGGGGFSQKNEYFWVLFIFYYFLLFFFWGGGSSQSWMGAFLCILCGIFLRPMYRMVIFWGDVKIEYMYCLGMPDIHNIIYFIFLGGGGSGKHYLC